MYRVNRGITAVQTFGQGKYQTYSLEIPDDRFISGFFTQTADSTDYSFVFGGVFKYTEISGTEKSTIIVQSVISDSTFWQVQSDVD